MESRKMVQINLFSGQEQSHGHREQTCGHRGEREGGMNGEIRIDIYPLPCGKQPVVSCCVGQGAQLGALWWPRGVGCGEQDCEGRDNVHVQLIDFIVQLETNTTLKSNYTPIKSF